MLKSGVAHVLARKQLVPCLFMYFILSVVICSSHDFMNRTSQRTFQKLLKLNKKNKQQKKKIIRIHHRIEKVIGYRVNIQRSVIFL